MKCDARLLVAKDVAEVTGNVKTVKLSEKLTSSDKFRAKNYACLLVSVPDTEGNTSYFRGSMNSFVPENGELVRDSTGQLVGIPAVAGG